ncbi:hypothetical protein ACFLIM_39385 [Nonomuraea sp. M3C6]|uniref:Uncharacterized protein n=1 Tax=Nonomuraea marmarensis TaxID=3351344 RepID=A0ABW7AQG6_9ACTN
MPRKMTGPEHAQAALEALAEAKTLAKYADQASSWESRAAYSAQASACAGIAAAEFQAAHLALQVVESRMPGLGAREVKGWRDITGVS